MTESATAPRETPDAPDPVVALVLRPGSPVRIGLRSTALAALRGAEGFGTGSGVSGYFRWSQDLLA